MGIYIWGGVGGGVPPDHPSLATNLTDQQWAVLAPSSHPIRRASGSWAPPVLIAANRWGFTQNTPGEFVDFVAMQEYYEVLRRFPALIASRPPPAPKKRGLPRDFISPRALLDAIFWKLATGRT